MPFEPDRIRDASAYLAKQLYLARSEDQLDLVATELDRLQGLEASYRALLTGHPEAQFGASHLCRTPPSKSR